jgi:hypothetical protein
MVLKDKQGTCQIPDTAVRGRVRPARRGGKSRRQVAAGNILPPTHSPAAGLALCVGGGWRIGQPIRAFGRPNAAFAALAYLLL